MDRAQLCQYIKKQFNVVGSYRWRRFPDNCVFISPVSKRWFAVLVRSTTDPLHLNQTPAQDFLDIYAGPEVIKLRRQAQYDAPAMMSSQDWVGVKLDSQDLDDESIQQALQRAFALTAQPNDVAEKEQLLHIEPVSHHDDDRVYHGQQIPFAREREHLKQRAVVDLPKPLRQMKSLYDYSLPPVAGRNQNFYIQGQAVADYEDDFAYQGDFKHFYPTYHDMSDQELRGYFSWRTKWRAGQYEKAPRSFLYVYLYELINNIGVNTPEEGFKKLLAFSQQADKQADKKMRSYISQWLKDYVVYYQLGEEDKQLAFADEIKIDQAYDVLLQSQKHEDQEIVTALDQLTSYEFAKKCPLMKKQPALAEKLVAESWRQLHLDETGGDAAMLLGWRGEVTVRLFGNAVFYNQQPVASRAYQVDGQRRYQCQWGIWHRQAITPLKGRSKKLSDFLHEIDAQLRQKFHVGRQLKARPLPDEQKQAIKRAWQLIDKEAAESRKRQVTINLGHLAKIRADAAETTNSLLTDEEKQAEREEQRAEALTAMQAPIPSPVNDENVDSDDGENQLDLSKDELYFLTSLVQARPYQEYLKKHHLMASILADQVNEKLFDEIGDTVIEFDADGNAQLVDDYRTDVEELLS